MNWYDHVTRRDEEHIPRKVLRMDIPWKRKTENKMERRMTKRLIKYMTENGRGDRQGDVDKEDKQSYQEPYMMGKARGKEDINFALS